ncbi:MAG: XRE family transcriptional regulator [Proteiniphilum sp.]|uniref:XRE family transcriptional regulator n=1 Tax=Proteiniphilum sp. TaxID=1926877 RepID=UPI0008E64D0B|nr:XRE family transcriptional regulator [Proteiniphilum sp.]MDY9918674.1 XRE family transcriptional regulator [Proteiniphilum sp.]SFK67386.1 Helix-turn-helix domain-containing protein [Porphyromonadaceae bacterium KH3CP3RA]
MKMKYLDLKEIKDLSQFKEIKAYYEDILQKATETGALEVQDADNEYIKELDRIGKIVYVYERLHFPAKNLKFKSPLIISIENELDKRQLKQRQAAELLDVKESTFSQIMKGKRSVPKIMAKKLYSEFNIDPVLILENL